MKDSKKNTIRDTSKEIMALPESKRNFVLGVMNGILITFQNEEKEKTKAVT